MKDMLRSPTHLLEAVILSISFVQLCSILEILSKIPAQNIFLPKSELLPIPHRKHNLLFHIWRQIYQLFSKTFKIVWDQEWISRCCELRRLSRITLIVIAHYHKEDQWNENFLHLYRSLSASVLLTCNGKMIKAEKRKRQKLNSLINESVSCENSGQASFFATPAELGCFIATSSSTFMKL